MRPHCRVVPVRLQALRTVTSAMDENQVTLGSRYLFITPTLKGVLDDYSYANPTMSNRVLERFARVIEVPQVRFYTAIDLKSGDTVTSSSPSSAASRMSALISPSSWATSRRMSGSSQSRSSRTAQFDDLPTSMPRKAS